MTKKTCQAALSPDLAHAKQTNLGGTCRVHKYVYIAALPPITKVVH